MKKISKLNFAVLALVVLFAAAFVSCGEETCENCGEDPCVCITVWTATKTNAEYQSIFNTNAFDDGKVRRVEYLYNTGRDGRVTALNGQENKWTEKQISKYFFDWGTTEEGADYYAKELAGYDHGYIAYRDGDTIEIIMK